MKPTPTLQDRFIRSIRTGKAEQPDFARGADIQKLLDASFQTNDLRKPIQIR